ncbi:hypothetical protein CQW23_25799 [Capsicum baccatum]|uniref:Uncharacterized protein n=1 Tax=Capsicum baccatum TaxID=33114 RepID=A0A2G2VM10_CAPBA|nr:hypothetical protein CQW23_25799 [Capsicum baccatum]
MVRLVGAERYVGIHFYSLLNEGGLGSAVSLLAVVCLGRGSKRPFSKAGVRTRRMKQTTGTLHKRVDGVWTEAEATAKKVYANVEEKISVTKEEVKESFGVGKQEAPRSSSHSDASSPNTNASSDSASTKSQKEQKSGFTDSAETAYRNVKSAASSKVSPFIQKIKEAKPVDFAKKGYDIILDELKGTPVKRKHSKYSAHTQETSSNFERSTRTDVVVVVIWWAHFVFVFVEPKLLNRSPIIN